MKLPFTIEQFLEVFRTYNTDIWPLQIVFIFLALIILFFAFRTGKYSGRIISLLLSVFWLWMGIVYHITYFAGINSAAYVFGTVFIIQGLLFFVLGVYKDQLNFEAKKSPQTYSAILLVIFALLIYPFLGYLLGHVYPESPTFGVPCPTTIFTLGILLLLKPHRIILMIIPLLWSVIGFTASFLLGITEDIGLLAAGITTLFFIFPKRTKAKTV